MPHQPKKSALDREALFSWLRSLRLVAPILLALAVPAIAWARAGGGEGFRGPDGPSGGGGDGGGGDGGGGGVFFLVLRLLFQLCLYYPAVGIPVTILVIAGVVIVLLKNKTKIKLVQAGDLDDDDDSPATDPVQAVALLQEIDPDFDEAVFLARVKNGFVKVQQAWAAQDLAAIRPFVSDGIVERFGLQFQEQKDAGYRNNMDKVSVIGSAVVQSSRGSIFNSVTVRIHATAADYKSRLSDGKFIEGDHSPQPFVEFWTFLRHAGGTSPKDGKPGLLEGNCPNCGASIVSATPAVPASGSATAPEIGGSAKCRSCGAVLRSGMNDWVLATITQDSVFRPRSSKARPVTIDLYQATRDKGFCLEQVEDRTSVIFWRLAKAQRVGKGEPLGKVATPDFRQAVVNDAKAHTDPGGRRTYFGKCAVGAVEALGVLPGPGMDQAFVRIEYSGTRIAAPVPGKTLAGPLSLPGGGAAPRYRVGIMTLTRKSGAVSDPRLGLSSAHCPGCGAPQSDETADNCAYCGYVTTDATDWVAKTMDDAQSEAGQSIQAELAKAARSPRPRSPSPEEGPA